MEEKKVLINEEMEGKNVIQPANQNNQKNSNTIVILLVFLVLVIACVVFYVFLLKPTDEPKTTDDNTTSPVTTVLTNDEALTIVMERLNTANSFFGSFVSSSECSIDENVGYCYYNAIDTFKNQFYNVYAKTLTYNDVFNGNQEYAPSIKINDNEVYVFNHCTEGSGDKSLKGNYVIKSITSKRITASYVIADTDPVTGTITDEEAEIELIKEDNVWKIVKVTLIGRCNGIYEVGK